MFGTMVGERRRLGRRRAMGSSLLRWGVPGALIVVIVGLLVAAVAQIGATSGPYRRTIDRGYAVLAAPLVADSNRTGTSLRTLVSSVRSYDRATLFAQLDEMTADAVRVQRAFAVITPPEPATAAAARCNEALADRVLGVESFQSALEGALGSRTGLQATDQATATAAIESTGASLARADAAWAACRHGLRKAPGSASVGASAWVRDPTTFGPSAAARLVAGVVTSRSLAPAHHLVLVGLVTEPAAVATGPTRVVPPTLRLTVHAVVADQGNVDEVGVEVGGTALVEGAPASPVPVQRTVDLAAGGSTTLTLPSFIVVPGRTYVLQITAEAPRATGPGPIASVSVPVQIQPATTVTAVVASANPAPTGKPVGYIALVSASLSGLAVPTGSVAFEDDGAGIPGCSALPLVAGRATCTSTYSSSSTHAITAVYSGNAQLASSNSGVFSERVGSG